MKRRNLHSISLLLCIIYCLSICFPLGVAKAEVLNDNGNDSNAKLIADIEGHWAEKQIIYWMRKGITNGYSDRTFKPDNYITRAEFLTLVNRAFGYTQTASVKFTDVSPKDWYYTEIAKAIAGEYVGGYPDNTIKPNEAISRQEVA